MTIHEERLLRMVLEKGDFGLPDIGRDRVRSLLALVDELRNEVARLSGRRVLPFAPPRRTPTIPPDPAA